MDIIEILLCEGRDVEQWLEPPNISWCLCLINYLSTLSLFISCIELHCSYSYARYSLCVTTLVFNQESFNSTSTLSLEESREVVPEPFTENSGSLLITHSVFTIKF